MASILNTVGLTDKVKKKVSKNSMEIRERYFVMSIPRTGTWQYKGPRS